MTGGAELGGLSAPPSALLVASMISIEKRRTVLR